MRTLTLLLLLLPGALAQVDLTLSPVRLEWTLPPGGQGEARVRIRNGLSREEPLSVRLEPFTLGPEGEVVKASDPGLCPYLEVTPAAFTLPGGGEVEVLVRGKAPVEGQGTLACLVLFGGQARPAPLGRVQVGLTPQLGLAVYLTIQGTERPALRGKVGGEGSALPLLLENPGNVLQRVSGEALVYRKTGEEVVRLPLEEVPLLPGGYRKLALRPKDPVPKGSYRVLVLLQTAYGRYALEGTWDVP